MTDWAGYSLEARCRLFHRRFPDKKLTLYRLCKVYREHGIKKKKIKKTEIISTKKKKDIKEKAIIARKLLEQAIGEGY